MARLEAFGLDLAMRSIRMLTQRVATRDLADHARASNYVDWVTFVLESIQKEQRADLPISRRASKLGHHMHALKLTLWLANDLVVHENDDDPTEAEAQVVQLACAGMIKLLNETGH